MLLSGIILVLLLLIINNTAYGHINTLPLKSLSHRKHSSIILSSTFESSISPEIDNLSTTTTTTSLPNLSERRPLKTALLALAARTLRGTIANEKEKELAFDLITKLESYNPIDNPSNNDMAIGNWELIYSNTNLFRSSPFFMAARAVCKEGEEASRFNLFCDLHRDALAFTNMGKITQRITSTELTSEFETTVPVVPGLPITITGTIVSNASIESKASNSWTLLMDKVRIKENSSNIPLFGQLLNQFTGLPIKSLGDILESTNSITGYTNPNPIFYTYYVDTHMRISRDQDDNVFVYNRV